MDELSKAAQRANLPTDDFSRLAFAGDLADVSVETLTKSMGKLAKAQGDAQKPVPRPRSRPSNGSASRSRTPMARCADLRRLHRLRRRLSEVQGPGDCRARDADLRAQLPGADPLLKDGAAGIRDAADESDRLHATITDKAGKAAEEFNDNPTRLKTAAQGVANVVAEDLLPDLVDLSPISSSTARRKATG